MRKTLDDYLAQIIFKLPEKSFLVWTFLIIVQAFQIIQTGLFMVSLLNPHNTLLYVMRKIIGIFSLRTFQEQFSLLCILIQILFFLYIILLVSNYVLGSTIGTSFLSYCQVWCPILISISVHDLFSYPQSAISITLSTFTIFSSIFLWGSKLTVMNQDYLSRNAKLSSFKSQLRMIIFCVQSFFFYFQISSDMATILIATSIGTLLVIFTLSVLIIENIDQQIEYLHFIKCIIILMFYVVLMIVHLKPHTGYLLVIVVIGCIVLEQTGYFKIMFEIKYNYLLNRVSKQQEQQDLIIFLEIVGGIHSVRQDGVQTLKGRSTSYWTDKNITFNFHLKAKQVCMEMEIKKYKDSGSNIDISNTRKQETCTIIEDYMIQKIRTKSKLLSFVLTSQYIKRQFLIKALSIHSAIDQQMSFNERIMKKVLKLRISHVSTLKDKMGSKYQLSQGFCCLQKSILLLKINQIIELREFFEAFLVILVKLSQNTSKLMSKLCTKTIKSKELLSILEQQSIFKEKLDKLIKNCDLKINKQVISLFYIYYGHFCSQKYIVFRTLASYLFIEQKIAIKTNTQIMVCMVSASQHNRGSIITANYKMVQFLGLDFQYIKQGVFHIEDFLPKPLSIIHNSLILRCLETGISSIIRTTNKFYILKGMNAFPVEFQVKFQPNTQGINFSCQIRVLDDNSFILYDTTKQVLGFSIAAQNILSKKNLECKYLYQIFGSGKRTVYQNIKSKQRTSQLISSSNTILQTKKFRTNLKTYKTKDFQLGICLFQKSNFDQPSENTINPQQSQRFQNQIQQSQQFQLDNVYQNYQLMILQNKICTMSVNTPIITTFKKIIILYGVFLVIATLVFYLLIINIIESSKATNTYKNFLFQNSIQSFLLRVDRVSDLHSALKLGYIPSNTTFSHNQTIFQFLQNDISQSIHDFANLKIDLFQSLSTLPQNFVDIITTKTVPVLLSSGQILDLPLYCFISYQLNNEFTKMSFTPEQWTLQNSGSSHKFLMDRTFKQIQEKLVYPILDTQNENNKNEKFSLMIFLICIESLATVGIIVASFMLHRIIKQKNKYIGLLSQLQNKYLCLKQNINYQITSLLNIIFKSSLNNLLINQSVETIQFEYGPSSTVFSNKVINIKNEDSELVADAQRYRSSIRKSIKNSILACKQYSIIIISIVIFLPIFAMLMIGYLNVANSTIQSCLYFNQFAKINLQTSICAAIMTNANIMTTTHTESTIMGMIHYELLPLSIQCLSKRQIQNKMKSFVPEVTENIASQIKIEDYLYLSKCNPGDSSCQRALSGSLKRGFSSGLLAYMSSIGRIYAELCMVFGQLSEPLLGQFTRMIENFAYYISKMLKMSGFVLEMIINIFEKNQTLIVLLMEISQFAEVVLIILFMRFIFKQKKEMYQLKREILTILPVDILVDNINFNFEIKNLS